MRGGRVIGGLVCAWCLLVPLVAQGDTAPAPLTLIPASWSSASRVVPSASEYQSVQLPSLLSRTLNVAHRMFAPDSNGLAGTLTDPLTMRSSPFPGGRKRYGPVTWENFGGPAFLWAMPAREMCERTNACLVLPPTTEPVNPVYGIVWTGGGGPVARLVSGGMQLGSLGAATFAVDGSFFGALVGYKRTAAAQQPTTTLGTNVGVGLAVGLPGVAIHLQVQSVLYLVERRTTQSIGSQVFATMAIDWKDD